jgi:hypothetical protein
MRDQLSETNSRVVTSVSKRPLSYPTASVHVAGLVITHRGKPISNGEENRKNV